MEEFIQHIMPEMVYNQEDSVFERYYEGMIMDHVKELGVLSELFEAKFGFYPEMRLDKEGNKMKARLWVH